MMKSFSSTSFVIGVMVGALFAAMWFFGDNIGFNPSGSLQSSATTTESSLQKSGAVSVVNQSSGDSVMVESVTVPPPGVWVAVRELLGRNLGNVLGATRVVGPHSSIEVSLLRPTEPNRSYAVQLYRDDNSGNFDPSVNSVYVDFDTGMRVVAYFTTTP
ncbi:MAG: hypothetical protein Q8L52_03010 [bacterium]|nr:hypothetical protein [bacterium]